MKYKKLKFSALLLLGLGLTGLQAQESVNATGGMLREAEEPFHIVWDR